MDAAQRIRSGGVKHGKLHSTSEQRILVENATVTIMPVRSQILYVPVYDPAAVVGAWPYPLDTWIQSPGYGLGKNIDFDQGAAIPASFWRNGIDWPGKRIVEMTEPDPETLRASTPVPWQHDPRHRHGVAYPTPALRELYGQTVASSMERRRGYRGFEQGNDSQAGGSAARQARLPPAGTIPIASEDAFYGFEIGRRVRVFSVRGNASLAAGAVKPAPRP